ncbi:tachykinin-3 [Colius striatus]|uniref:tachykinin-3 n=1 Tax=Colius striatus TaxID=57412 RepID=UPI002B1D0F25|nr:tachykinin-3 [Colius striatus]
MRSRPLLAALLALALPLALARRPPAAAPAQGIPVPEPLSRRSAYAVLLQLLREEDAGEGGGTAEGRSGRSRPAAAVQALRSLAAPPAAAAPLKRDMHDFFVGLMGKRAAEPVGRGGGGPAPRCSPGPSAAGAAPPGKP